MESKSKIPSCKECHIIISDGQGRFNYPKGTYCIQCGSRIDDLLKNAEILVKQYVKETGYTNVRIKYY